MSIGLARFPQVLLEVSSRSKDLSDFNKDRMLSVIVKISNLEQWKQLRNIQSEIAIPVGKDRWIVPADIPISQVEDIAQRSFVVGMELSTKVWPANNESTLLKKVANWITGK